ncbi:restriction endonuclease subunit S [Micromonospora sp. NBC_00617]|uniref:restriction endonuclease subunit S n=1 Tax=Micromonospora sp. NBC_00617 TaxID=2903587 RepID=UPI0030E2E4BB
MTWKATTLRTAAEVVLGRQRAPQHAMGPDMVPYLRAANVKDGNLDLEDVLEMNFTPREQLNFGLRSGDVLVTEGSGSRSVVGASAVWRGEIEGTVCFQNTLLRVRPRPEVMDGRFLAWWAQAARAMGLFASIAGGANIYHLSADRVRQLPLDLPPIDEQRRIADFLDAELARMDALARAREDQIRLLTERSEAMVASAISDRFSEYGTVPLRRIWSGIEQGWSPQCEDVPADPDTWAVLKTSAVSTGIFNPLAHKRLPADVKPDLRYVVNDGDLLLTRGSGSPAMVGVATVADTGGRHLLLSDLLYRLRLQPEWPASFVACVLGSRPVREQVSLLLRGQSGQTIKLRGQDVGDILVPRVPSNLLGPFTAEVTSMQEKHADAARRIGDGLRLMHERRQALIAAAVTGQIDVTAAGSGGMRSAHQKRSFKTAIEC